MRVETLQNLRSLSAKDFVSPFLICRSYCLFNKLGFLLIFSLFLLATPNGPFEKVVMSHHDLHLDKYSNQITTYAFQGVQRSFRSGDDYVKFSLIDRKEFSNKLIKRIPRSLRTGAKKAIPSILYYAEKYQIDPLWVMSIAWAESHFNGRAKSFVGAQGIMQVMPKTQAYLLTLLKVKNHPVMSAYDQNIELGVFYLKKLLRQFNGNYTYATVAYNMGPGWVKRWLRKGRKVGSRHNVYLFKVKRAYSHLDKYFGQKLSL